jgi:hypothetical protein
MQCSLLKVMFGGRHHLHLQDVSLLATCFMLDSFTFKREVTCSPKRRLTFYELMSGMSQKIEVFKRSKHNARNCENGHNMILNGKDWEICLSISTHK